MKRMMERDKSESSQLGESATYLIVRSQLVLVHQEAPKPG